MAGSLPGAHLDTVDASITKSLGIVFPTGYQKVTAMIQESLSPPEERLRVREVESNAFVASLAEDVRRGLTSSPKFLYPKYFYDALGSKLFEAICELPEYYVTRAETEIFVDHAGEIAAALAGPPVRLVELGSGEGRKTRLLIEAVLERQGGLEYLPIDISRTAVEESGEKLLLSYPELRIDAWVGEFIPTLQALAKSSPAVPGARTLALFLGSTLGNLDPAERVGLLASVRAVLRPGDGFLVGVDLRKPESVLVPAYDDPLGVTAAFNLNLLKRINRELDGDFDLASFRHRARWDGELSRIEMHLESLRAQTVSVRGLGLEVPFAAGETIHTESSYKFESGQIAQLAAETGFRLERVWTDGERRFGSHLLVAA
jgi:L-histidine N-alpha-methyltransferase